MLQSEVFVSTENHCSKLTADRVKRERAMSCMQPRGSRHQGNLALYSLDGNPGKNVIIRSPSGDTDIVVIMICKLLDSSTRCFLDNSTGNNRKGLWLSNVNMNEDAKLSLIGFHAFTGNDYVSSFFRKGKAVCWKVVEKNPRFLQAFKAVGLAWDLMPAIYEVLEEYFCYLYGLKKRK